mmetsp:Transcript_24592/g.74025  ORF Transcript_24592/g.74025 Transcript_24592/m.74025 type:complete len:260 (+) Transcript_24592:911-1690(+)
MRQQRGVVLVEQGGPGRHGDAGLDRVVVVRVGRVGLAPDVVDPVKRPRVPGRRGPRLVQHDVEAVAPQHPRRAAARDAAADDRHRAPARRAGRHLGQRRRAQRVAGDGEPGGQTGEPAREGARYVRAHEADELSEPDGRRETRGDEREAPSRGAQPRHAPLDVPLGRRPRRGLGRVRFGQAPDGQRREPLGGFRRVAVDRVVFEEVREVHARGCQKQLLASRVRLREGRDVVDDALVAAEERSGAAVGRRRRARGLDVV